jgi:CBS domain-containing protein
MLVKEVMKKPVCITAEETLEVAVSKLKEHNVGCLPVCEGKQVLGMITDRDILTRCVGNRRNITQMKAREAMSTEVHCCVENDPVEQAASIMANNQVRRLPVIDCNRELVGIISLTDLTGTASGQARFEVVFYKEICDSYGRPHHGELTRIAIAPGHTKEEAIAAAIRQAEGERHSAWKTFADGYDVTEVQSDELGRIVEKVERTSEKEK